MRERTSYGAVESRDMQYATLEQWARGKIQAQLQQLLEEEVTTFLGRTKHERRSKVAPVDPPAESRNGHGKSRAFAMRNGTVMAKRPRVRDLMERFESTVLPVFRLWTQAVGTMLPELYLHGLLALRGLLGEGASLSASSIQRNSKPGSNSTMRSRRHRICRIWRSSTGGPTGFM
jgi:transposase-like protein